MRKGGRQEGGRQGKRGGRRASEGPGGDSDGRGEERGSLTRSESGPGRPREGGTGMARDFAAEARRARTRMERRLEAAVAGVGPRAAAGSGSVP
jgi:hypothetical protein